MAEWISVKDRLPERSDSYDEWKKCIDTYSENEIKELEKAIVVLTTFDGFVEVLPYFIEDPNLCYGIDRGPGFYFYAEDNFDSFCEKNDSVTHWMPLPKPPFIVSF